MPAGTSAPATNWRLCTGEVRSHGTIGATSVSMDKPPSAQDKPVIAKLAARRKREAEALRANLRKRKDQARAREKAEEGVICGRIGPQ